MAASHHPFGFDAWEDHLTLPFRSGNYNITLQWQRLWNVLDQHQGKRCNISGKLTHIEVFPVTCVGFSADNGWFTPLWVKHVPLAGSLCLCAMEDPSKARWKCQKKGIHKDMYRWVTRKLRWMWKYFGERSIDHGTLWLVSEGFLKHLNWWFFSKALLAHARWLFQCPWWCAGLQIELLFMTCVSSKA